MANGFPKLALPVFFWLTSLVFAGPRAERVAIPTPSIAVAGYRFDITTDIVNLTQPITISALDEQGHVIAYNGQVTLNAIQPDGAAWTMSPSTVQLSGGVWTGNITLPAGYRLPIYLRATDENSVAGTSRAFDVMRTLPVKTADIVWDATRNRIYGSVPANGGAYANRVVAIDPDSLQITASIALNQDPRKLALTSGGEALYVALDANGTIAKVDPGSMSLISTFSVGADSYGPLYAADMCAVTGQPNVVVVSRYSRAYAGGASVAAFENGLMRPNRAYVTDRIEPSADPAIFFGYETYSSAHSFRRLRLDGSGMNLVAEGENLIGGYDTEIHSNGDTIFSTTGVEVNGAAMIRSGIFPLINPTAAVCPDMAANRVNFIDKASGNTVTLDRIKAFDPTTFAFMRELTLPSIVPGNFIRWGTNGFAIEEKIAGFLCLINSNRLVPNDPPADLAVTIGANPNPAWAGQPLEYTVSVVNNGPNSANDVLLRATLSDSQILQSVTGTGPVNTDASGINLRVQSIPAGQSATLVIRTLPGSPGMLFCKATTSSSATDPDATNNAASRSLQAGFHSHSPDEVNAIRLSANNLVYDKTRNRLWVTISNSGLGSSNVFPDSSLVAIDPTNGLTSDPILINDRTVERSMALSPDGRYLYVGLYVPSQLLRVDLTSVPPAMTRINLGTNPSGQPIYAQDIEVLEGDGTSFLMTGAYDHAAVVFDGSTPRPIRTAQYSVSRIEGTASPNLFVGYNNYTFPQATFALTKLSVTAAGVSIVQSNSSLIISYYADLAGSGNLVLSSTGKLLDSSAFTVRADWGIRGTPRLDSRNNRAYLLNGSTLYAFDAATGGRAGVRSLPGYFDDWGQGFVRWGDDGFAIAAFNGNLYCFRWPSQGPGITPRSAGAAGY